MHLGRDYLKSQPIVAQVTFIYHTLHESEYARMFVSLGFRINLYGSRGNVRGVKR